MYEFIRGTLVQLETNKAIVDVNGVGYKIFIPINSYSAMPVLKSTILLYTTLIVREDSHSIYGFLNSNERDLFETLINVSGIGPKTAMSIIGHIDYENFYNAVTNGDYRLISKVPGIGKKTAQRILIEISGKLDNYKIPISNQNTKNSISYDAMTALINLGYNPIQAQKAIKIALEENNDEKDIGKLVSFALRKI